MDAQYLIWKSSQIFNGIVYSQERSSTLRSVISNENIPNYVSSAYLVMNPWLWIPQSFEKFQNAIFFKISKIPFMG